MPVVAVAMLGATGIVELSDHALAQSQQQELQQSVISQPITVQPADRGHVVEALSKGDFTAAERILSDLQRKLQATSGLAAQGGSVFFEELKACGFYPQETRLACEIEIKQQAGYAGQVGAFGSMEHVYICVDWDNNGDFTQLESAGQGSVQMHDDFQSKPPWSYIVYRDFNPFGGSRTTNSGATATTTSSAPTFRVQATLSWFAAPTGCNYLPVWGNSLVFQIRMDPIR
jgi:hypothetical protein